MQEAVNPEKSANFGNAPQTQDDSSDFEDGVDAEE
jgi:hypothetical protein